MLRGQVERQYALIECLLDGMKDYARNQAEAESLMTVKARLPSSHPHLSLFARLPVPQIDKNKG